MPECLQALPYKFSLQSQQHLLISTMKSAEEADKNFTCIDLHW